MCIRDRQTNWPTSDELAEAYSLGCMVCGEPGSSFQVYKRLTGSQYGAVKPDGDIAWGDPDLTGESLELGCTVCGEVIWEK